MTGPIVTWASGVPCSPPCHPLLACKRTLSFCEGAATFRKAFDTVPHERLVLKLEAYGITGRISGWVKSFLSDRSQRVRVNDDFSGNTAVKSGIPQGSILGPILFTIFINDLPKDIDVYCKLFADDTKVLEGADRKDSIQRDLDKLQEWSELWQLLFNVDKCKVLHMGKNNPNNVYFMRMNDI
mgnify:CR=1 FL=1